MNQNFDPEKSVMTLSDLLNLFRRSKRTILKWVVVFGVLGFYFALAQPIRYRAEATFREKGKKSGQMSSSILQLLGSDSLSSSQDNEAALMIKSRRLLKEVIGRLNLQGQLEPRGHAEGLFKLMGRNFKLAWAALTRHPHPLLADSSSPLRIDYIHYNGELPLNFEVKLKENGEYDLIDSKYDRLVGQGKLDEPFIDNQMTLILAAHQQGEIDPQNYSLRVDSLADTALRLSKDLDVQPTKTDKSVLKISYDHRNRHLACDLINTTMDCYQEYLKNYHGKLSQIQLNYLHSRQDHLAENLNTLMQKHADFLSDDLFNSGFVNSDKEMDFLARNQHEYKDKLLANELEIKRLENVQSNIYVHYDRYSSNDGDALVINNVLNQIREFKQKRDGLEIEIQKKADLNSQSVQDAFNQQQNELHQIQLYLAELHDIIDRFHQGIAPDAESQLVNDPRFLIKGWSERIEKQKDLSDRQKTADNFQFYLMNLERLFLVHEKILQERLTHQQNPSGEYQGIDFKAADELYVDYSKQLIQIESTIRQSLFFITQMEDPQFEVTSLSSMLTDPVSQDMIRRASDLVLTLRDQNNQSAREQERLKDELNLQRTFLALHLKQMVQLMELNKQLINEKVYALQNVSIELIHRQISLLENTLKDYLESRLENLRQERELIKEHLKHIRNEMTSLPKKWVAEQLIEQEVATNQLIVEEIAKMVESKNITQNLEMIQSAPIDLAIAPVYPQTPKVLLFSLLGCFLGGILGIGSVLGKTIMNGLPASEANLKLLGYHISGSLSHSKEDREVLRRLQNYLRDKQSSLLLLVEGKGPGYSTQLADLFLKRGEKVLLLDLDLDHPNESRTDGLIQYLEETVDVPAIQPGSHGDRLLIGGSSPFANELLGSIRFKKLLENLQQKYDWVIGITHVSPLSVEAENLLQLFANAAITLTSESVDDLSFYVKLVEDPTRKVSFIFSEVSERT